MQDRVGHQEWSEAAGGVVRRADDFATIILCGRGIFHWQGCVDYIWVLIKRRGAEMQKKTTEKSNYSME